MSTVREEARLLHALEQTTSAGVRVIGLRLLSYAVGFVASVLIARSLGPDGRGLYALPVAVLGIVLAFSNLGLEHANVFLAGRGVPLRTLWTTGAVSAVLASLATWAVVAVLYEVTHGAIFAGLPASWIVVAMVQVPLLLQVLYWTGVLQLSGRIVGSARASLAGAAAHAVVVATLFAAGALTPFRVLVLTAVTTGVTWLAVLALSVRTGLAGFRSDRSVLLRAAAFGLKGHAGILFLFLTLRLDQVLVQRFLGFRELGLYALAVTLAELILLTTDPIAQAALPHQIRAARGDDRRLTFSTARLNLEVAVVVSVAAWVLAPGLIRLVYGPAFSEAVWPFRLLLPGVVALAVYRPLAQFGLKEGRAWLLSGLGLATLIANVVLNLVLLPKVGVVGASLASAFAYCVLAAAYVYAVGRPRGAGWRDLVPRGGDIRMLRRAARPHHRRPPGPLRVMFVIGSLDRGGTERQVLTLAGSLRRRGWVVTVLCLEKPGDQADLARSAGVEVMDAGFAGARPWNPFPLWRCMRRAFRAIRQRRPDVVHTLLYWGNLVGIPIARLGRVPVVVGSRRSLFDLEGSRAPLRPWLWVADRSCDVIVCNSEAVLRDAAARSRSVRRKGLVIRNGVEGVPEITPPGSGVILAVANFHPYKGHRHLLAGFAAACGRLPADTPLVLRLVGGGQDQEAMRALAKRLGVEDRVEFLGVVADVGPLLQSCSFTVLPSLSEGFPNAVLESLAHGRAVIGSRVGGIAEILEQGGGVLVPTADPEALADAIVDLVLDPIRTRQLGEEGSDLVRTKFGVDRMVEQHIRLYAELLGAAGDDATLAHVAGEAATTGIAVGGEGSVG